MVGSSSSSAEGLPNKRLREKYADLLPALQLAHLALVEFRLDAQPVEQHAGVRLRSVAALFADDALEFAQAHAIVMGQVVVGLGI